MTINKTNKNGKIIFSLEGRLDTATSPKLQEVLMAAFDEAKEVTLDFSKLAYVSSAGLRVLLMGRKAAKKSGGVMTLTAVPDDIMEVLEMTGFVNMLTII